MKSPFPGMDPFLENHWPDIHTALIAETRRTLNRVLPTDLIARAEERLAVESMNDPIYRIAPDVHVFSPSIQLAIPPAGAVTVDASYRLEVDLDPVIERFIRIINQDGEVITVLEFISPADKRSPGLAGFRQKRDQLLRAGVHLVEIDRVRAGDWRALLRPEACPVKAIATYRVTIRTSGSQPAAYLFPINVSDPLPAIPLPLRPGDAKVMLPLGELVDAVYLDGRYGDTLDYSELLEPPLSESQEVWMTELLSRHRSHELQ